MTNKIQEYSDLINNEIDRILSSCFIKETIVFDAMSYSIKNAGKRIRPILTLEFCNLTGGTVMDALPFACAVEMIHTYSLIHDDLPCMDNDDFRRGKPSCHIKFGEAFALLAGDALLTLAFETIANSSLSADKVVKAVKILSEHSGYLGMIGGQTIDLMNEGKTVTADDLMLMDSLKTGKLIECACLLGCVAGNADELIIKNAKIYAKNIGMAFQVVDDILDVTSTFESLGKLAGSDVNNQKSTYVSLLGIEKSKEIAEDFTNKALESISMFKDKGNFLKEFSQFLLKRKS